MNRGSNPCRGAKLHSDIYEREGRAIYHTAVLIGRNGEVVGNY